MRLTAKLFEDIVQAMAPIDRMQAYMRIPVEYPAGARPFRYIPDEVVDPRRGVVAVAGNGSMVCVDCSDAIHLPDFTARIVAGAVIDGPGGANYARVFSGDFDSVHDMDTTRPDGTHPACRCEECGRRFVAD